MVRFMWDHYPAWVGEYLATKKSEESGITALKRMCQRIADR